ncbi:hypothetical protein N7508_002451 [Penicillium antarcticum]|uniref:uncharacterized protein n=1 Tax=Penicillium antarcticum TaxID=416450 RepID=UPI002397D583|nr:uncharacterized protein N7508_002451 [Penicillium antarcticum]KAJ5317943.1 hypothetical protein N7508_002451 [Penicillium antarcticum]
MTSFMLLLHDVVSILGSKLEDYSRNLRADADQSVHLGTMFHAEIRAIVELIKIRLGRVPPVSTIDRQSGSD